MALCKDCFRGSFVNKDMLFARARGYISSTLYTIFDKAEKYMFLLKTPPPTLYVPLSVGQVNSDATDTKLS